MLLVVKPRTRLLRHFQERFLYRRASVRERVPRAQGRGQRPEGKRVYGLGFPLLNRTPGRREVSGLTGQTWMPVLVTDDGVYRRIS
jgi:hypothetical protein